MGKRLEFRRLIPALFLFVSLMTGAQRAAATPLYGTNSLGQFFSIDDTTGATTLISNLGITPLGVASFTNGTMYVRDFGNLYTVDKTTGVKTLVGVSGSGITGLAADLANTTLYSVNQNTGAFFTVNPLTGAATFVGNTGVATLPLDLTTNPFTGQLLLTNLIGDIYSINPTTGSGTLITPTVTSNIGGGGLTALSFNAAGDLFGVTSASEQLVRINLALGTSIAVSGALGFTDVRGLDFDRTVTNAAVPEPTSLLLLGTGCAALVRRARRR
jgi:hypothetical protein